MNTKPRLGPDDPLVQAAFLGVYKSGRRLFFRINADGQHQKIAVVHALDDVSITYENKMELIASFPFPLLTYSSERMKLKAAAVANRKPKPVRAAAAADDEEIADEEPEADVHLVNSKRNPEYFLVAQNNGYYGCFNAREGEVIAMFKTKAEAEAFVKEQLHGGWNFKAFYGNKAGQG